MTDIYINSLLDTLLSDPVIANSRSHRSLKIGRLPIWRMMMAEQMYF